MNKQQAIPPMGVITKEDGVDVFVWRGGFETRHLPKEAGFKWNPQMKSWRTTSVEVASKLSDYAQAGGNVERKINAHKQLKEESLTASSAHDADIDIPAPDGLEYMPFQKAGIKYALGRKSTLIADQMGTGKTIQALGVANACPDVQTILIICPASLRLNWKQEAEKWLLGERTIQVVDAKNPPSHEADVLIINYDIIKKNAEFLAGFEWDLLIVDEAHYLKNPKTQRTKNVLGGGIKAKRSLFLTGTPIVNKPIEIQPILAFINPDDFGNFFQFAKRYANAYQSRWGWDFSGASNLGELQEKLRSTCMVRRLKADVLTELPAKRRSVIEIPANGKTRFIKAEQKAVAFHEENILSLKVAVETAKTVEDAQVYEDAVKALQGGVQAMLEEISRLRKETALAKAPVVADHVKNLVEETDQKVVVFAHHHEVLDALVEAFGELGVVKLDGRDSMHARNDAVNSFQTDDDVKVFVGGIQAAGVGLTLTASSHVIFAELDWVPGNMSQCEDSCHRIGQTDNVVVQHIVLEDSIDVNMAKTIVKKQAVIDSALDKPIAKTEVQPTSETEVQPTSETVSPFDFEDYVSPSRSEIEHDADLLSVVEIEQIHEHLNMLANRCDGALAEDGALADGQGFNKIDSTVGKQLASSEILTQRQAAFGKRILNKYSRQLQ